MKQLTKIFFVIFFIFSLLSQGQAAELQVGEKAPAFALPDASGKVYTLESAEFAKKVMVVFYVDPAMKKLNKHVEKALAESKEIDHGNNYVELYVSNLKASKAPNIAIKRAMKNKQESTDAVILLDKNYAMINLWGLKNHSSDIVVLDKDRICRYKYSGSLPPAEVEKLIEIIKEYQFQW